MDAFLTDKAERLAREMASRATTLEDLNGPMRATMKSALERMLRTEMDHHLKTTAQPHRPQPVGPARVSTRCHRRRRNGTAATAIPKRRCKAIWDR